MSISIFIQNALPAGLLAECLKHYSTDVAAGAYSCFMGQVRADKKDDREVQAIEYTAYVEMADVKMQEIATEVKEQYKLNALEVRHSLGTVMAGGICLFVLAIAGHRKASMEACNLLVERIKSELPVWGREIFADEGYQWKVNK